jgi:hypothetical protein
VKNGAVRAVIFLGNVRIDVPSCSIVALGLNRSGRR